MTSKFTKGRIIANTAGSLDIYLHVCTLIKWDDVTQEDKLKISAGHIKENQP